MLIECTHLILDACCVLNFDASGCFMKILQSLPAQVVVTQVVRERELLSLQKLNDERCDNENQTAQQPGQNQQPVAARLPRSDRAKGKRAQAPRRVPGGEGQHGRRPM